MPDYTSPFDMPIKIMVVNDSAGPSAFLCRALQEAGFHTVAFGDAEAALTALDLEEPPALILADLYLPGLDSGRFCRLLRSAAYEKLNHTPILIVAAACSGDETARMVLEFGADAFLPLPVDAQALVEQVRALLNRKRLPARFRVLIVESDSDFSARLVQAFEMQGYLAQAVSTCQESFHWIEKNDYDVLVLDSHLTDGPGDRVLKELHKKSPDCVCMGITADPQPRLALAWMKMGAADCLKKPFEPEYLITHCERARRERSWLQNQILLNERTHQLQESEKRLHSILDATHDEVWEWDIHRGYINPPQLNMLGYSAENLPDMSANWPALLHPQDREAVLVATQACLRNKTDAVQSEFRIRNRDGQWRWILSRGYVLHRDADGHVLQMIGTYMDITHFKQTEEALRMSETRYRAFFEQSPHGVVVLDPQTGRMLEFNDQVCRQLGYTRAELTQMGVADIEVVESPQEVLAHIQKILREGHDIFETRHRTRQGEIRNIQVLAQVIQAGDHPIYHCIWRDITEQKQAERILAESEARLLEAQKVSHTGSWELDLVARTMWGSIEAHQIYGLDPTPDLHLPLVVVQSLVEPEYRALLDQALKDLIQTGEQRPYNVEFFIQRHSNGERRAIHSIARLVRDEQGRPVRVVGTIQDITERKFVEEEIRRLNNELEHRVRERTAQLEAANKELEAFSYSVSHDLRAPLRALNGYSYLLLNDYADRLDEEGREYLARIQGASQQMGQLINDLLNLARVTRSGFIRQPVDLSALAYEIAADLQNQNPERPVELEIAADMLVEGDKTLLKIVLENLLNNAFKFTARNTGPAVIQIGIRQQNDECIYFVRDNGVGFDMKYADKLFTPFQRLHGPQEFTGTGIGLSIVQRIITRHGGRIWPESKPGQGATFYFTVGA